VKPSVIDARDPRQVEVEGLVKDLAEAVHDQCPPHVGYLFVVYDRGERGFMAYAANSERADVVALLRELADKLEAEAAEASSRG
jgi:hypothetical protein